MIKINVLVENQSWKRYIKNPENYLKKKIKKLENNIPFKNKKIEYSLLLSNTRLITKLNLKLELLFINFVIKCVVRNYV